MARPRTPAPTEDLWSRSGDPARRRRSRPGRRRTDHTGRGLSSVLKPDPRVARMSGCTSPPATAWRCWCPARRRTSSWCWRCCGAGCSRYPLDPRLTPAERRPLFADLEPHHVVTDPAEVTALLDELGPGDGVPRGRPIHVTSGTTGRPKGVLLRVVGRGRRRRAGARGAGAVGLRRRRRQPGAESPAPLRPAALRARHPARGRAHDHPRAVRPEDRHRRRSWSTGRRRCSACRPTCSGSSPTGTRPASPTSASYRLVAHAGAPCPPAVKERLVELFPDGSTWEFYGSTERHCTACRSEEEPGAAGHSRACPPRPHDERRRRRHPVVRGAGARPVQLLRCAGEDRGRLARDRPRTGVHGRGHRPHRRRRLRVPRRPPRGPGDLRRCQRLPDRGGERAPRGRRGRSTSRCSASTTTAGGSGCARRSWARPTPTRSTSYARERLAPPKRPKEYHRVDELPRTATGKVRRLDLPAVVRPRPTSPRG